MEDRRIDEAGGNIIKDILFAIRRNIILILLILIIGAGCGLGYAYIKKPNYTAGENVVYLAKEVGGKDGTASSVNIMRAYFNTVVDFCDEGVVTDRANHYYVAYLNEKRNSAEYTVGDFIKNDIEKYSNNVNLEAGKYILKNKISVTADVASADTEEFSFIIKYTDPDKQDAADKVKLLLVAIIDELEIEDGQNVYFDTVENQLVSLGFTGVSSDVSKSRFTIVGFIVGAILAAVVVYLKTLFDNTVSSKELLEGLTGVPVLSVIEKEGGNK